MEIQTTSQHSMLRLFQHYIPLLFIQYSISVFAGFDKILMSWGLLKMLPRLYFLHYCCTSYANTLEMSKLWEIMKNIILLLGQKSSPRLFIQATKTNKTHKTTSLRLWILAQTDPNLWVFWGSLVLKKKPKYCGQWIHYQLFKGGICCTSSAVAGPHCLCECKWFLVLLYHHA